MLNARSRFGFIVNANGLVLYSYSYDGRDSIFLTVESVAMYV